MVCVCGVCVWCVCVVCVYVCVHVCGVQLFIHTMNKNCTMHFGIQRLHHFHVIHLNKIITTTPHHIAEWSSGSVLGP